MDKINPKRLIVEGEQDKRVIPYLIEANGIPWGETRKTAIVDIASYGSDQFIDSVVISTELKASELQSLGLIVDADDNLEQRWQSIYNACIKVIPDFPKELPENGLIHLTPEQIKFGVWIMPDNRTQGMLETFLAYLIPAEGEPLWDFAKTVTQEAKNQGAKYIDAHFDKSSIYTWLAWQNPPGRQLHNAVMERILDPTHPKSQSFISWFKNLYDL